MSTENSQLGQPAQAAQVSQDDAMAALIAGQPLNAPAPVAEVPMFAEQQNAPPVQPSAQTEQASNTATEQSQAAETTNAPTTNSLQAGDAFVALEDDVNMDDEKEAKDTSEDATTIRANAVFLEGVENMSAGGVEAYVSRFYERPFAMEWVDDRSVVLAYDNDEDAFQSIVALTAESEFMRGTPIEPLELRATKTIVKKDGKTSQPLKARFATKADKKPAYSRKQSKYYQRFGAPSRREDRTRFGSSRSAPMKYGSRDLDLFVDHRSAHEDLFPDKLRRGDRIHKGGSSELSRKARAAQADLFATPSKGRGSRGRGGRGRGRGGKRSILDDEPRGSGPSGSSGSNGQSRQKNDNSVFSNMDY